MSIACIPPASTATATVYDYYLSSVAETEWFAGRLAAYLKPPLLMTLSGDIGAGKTTLIRAMLRAMGVMDRIKSPTFSLIESYHLPSTQVHHFDLYRIVDETELDFMGFRDYFQPTAICCVEWPERIHLTDNQVDLAFFLLRSGEGRQLRMVMRDPTKNMLQQFLSDIEHLSDERAGLRQHI